MEGSKYWEWAERHNPSDGKNISEPVKANPDSLPEKEIGLSMEDRETLDIALNNLSNDHKFLIIKHFGLDGKYPVSLRVLAQELGMSKTTLARHMEDAKLALKKEMLRLNAGGKKDGDLAKDSEGV